MSIDAQIHELNAQAARAGITLVGAPMSEEMSAKRPGRPVFAALLERIGRREADGILCWHLDRLARNPIDGAAIMWALSEGKVQAVVTPDRTYTGSGDDKLMMSIIFGMATKYSDDLSKNIRRGYQEALRRGEWPCSNVPIGYMRDPVTKLCVPDPERWEQLRQLWQMRLAGTPVEQIVQVAQTTMGLRTRPSDGRRRTSTRAPAKGHLVSRSNAFDLFNNPFYAGMMRVQGNVYPGVHSPMVTADEFLRAKTREQVPRHATGTERLPLPYRGLFRCGDCGHVMTVDRKVKPSGRQFVYLRCSGRANRTSTCSTSLVSRSAVDAAVRVCLESVALPREVVSAVLNALAGIEANQKDVHAEQERRREAQVRDVMARQQRAVEAFVAGHMTDDELAAIRANLEIRRQALATPQRANDAFTPLKEQLFSLGDVVSRFDDANDEQKSALVGALCSDRIILGKKVLVSAVEPLRTLCKSAADPVIWTLPDEIQTRVRQLVLGGGAASVG